MHPRGTLRHPSLAILLLVTGVACGDDGETGGAGGEGAQGGEGAGGVPAAGGGGGTGEGGAGGFEPFEPGPEDVQFQSVSPLPLGEWLLFNDWNPQPNEVLAMRPDGTGEVVVFRAYRIWAMGVSRDQNKIAFSAGDPEQEAHYGVTIGDAIQPTFVYDAIAESATNLTFGNINDECLHFGPSDKYLYLCRRYDFTPAGTFSGYRIGRVDLETKAFSWLSDEDPDSLVLYPAPIPDETQVYFARYVIGGKYSILRAPLPSLENEQPFQEDASAPVLDAAGTRMLYQDYAQQGAIVAVDLDTGDRVVVAEGPDVSTARFSPDGARVAFLRWDAANVCSHVEIARSDGSEASSPARVHDCAVSGRFVTELEWVDR